MESLRYITNDMRHAALYNYTWNNDTEKSIMKAFAEGENDKSVYLYGKPGVGKTHLFVGMYRYLAQQYHEGPDGISIFCGVTSWNMIVPLFREMLLNKTPWEKEVLYYARSKFLFIDDLSLKPGKFECEVFRYLLEACYNSGTRMFVTSNIRCDALSGLLDVHTMSRFNHMFVTHEIVSTDYRKRVRDLNKNE